MLRTRQDVDRHVEKILAKLKGPREKNFRGYSIARLYFDVAEYETCVRYAERYLTVKNDNAAAHCLLGQALAKLGRNRDALEEFKTSLELDPNQTNLIARVCEILSDETVEADSGQVRYWSERAEAALPRHPALFGLTKRLLRSENADSSALIALLRERVSALPADAASHSRLLCQLMECGRVDEAFAHALQTHTGGPSELRDSLLWQDAVIEVTAAHRADPENAWDHWSLRLTALERRASVHSESRYTHADASDSLEKLDRALWDLGRSRNADVAGDLSRHFGAQLCLHAGTLLLKKALNRACSWSDAVRLSSPLFLSAYQTDSPHKQRTLADLWPAMSADRKSQAGHALLAFARNKKQSFLDAVSQVCSGKQWRERIHRELFPDGDRSPRSSFLRDSDALVQPKPKMPVLTDVQEHDLASVRFMPDCLHRQVWIGANLDRPSRIRSDVKNLPSSVDNLPNCGPETLSNADLDAFLYCAVLIAQQNALAKNKKNEHSERPPVLPAALTEPLCTGEQSKWWKYAKRLSESESETPDVRLTLTRGIECVRCIADHGLDPYVLVSLGQIFMTRAENESVRRQALMKRSLLYYSAALPLLERLRDRIFIDPPSKRLFPYSHSDMPDEKLSALLQECKLHLGKSYMDENDTSRAVELLSGVRSPYASFYLYKIYSKLAEAVDKNDGSPQNRNKYYTLLSKARNYIYTTSDRLKDSHASSDHPLAGLLNDCIENVESLLSTLDRNETDHSFGDPSVTDYFSEGNYSTGDAEVVRSASNNLNDASLISNTPRSVEAQVRRLQQKEQQFNNVTQQIGTLLESNKLLTEQVRDFKLSLDEIKLQNFNNVDRKNSFNAIEEIHRKVDELKYEYVSNISDLKRDITDLKKEFEKLKISSTATQRSEEELFLLEETYRNNAAGLSYVPRLPNTAAGLPHPYSLYGHPNFYQLYSGQYPAVSSLFPPALLQPDQSIFPELLLSNQINAAQVLQAQNAQSHIPPQQQPLTQGLPNFTLPQATTQATFPSVPSQSQPQPQPQVSANLTANLPTNQPAVHDYQIPLPQSNQAVPQFLVNNQTSTPNKVTFDSLNPSNASFKPFGSFDIPKTTAATDQPKPLSLFSSPNNQIDQSAIEILKNRSVSERSDESYDPCPDFKPVIPLPDEVVPTTGEENETVLFDSRAKLFRFVNDEWKERGLGQLKLLKNNENEKVRLLMRRDTVHTICANHFVTPEMDLSLMKGADKAYFWVANDFADETVKLEKFCVRFKTFEIGKKFYDAFNSAKNSFSDPKNKNEDKNILIKKASEISESNVGSLKCLDCRTDNSVSSKTCKTCETSLSSDKTQIVTTKPTTAPISYGGLTFTSPPVIKPPTEVVTPNPVTVAEKSKPNPFANLTFAKATNVTVTATSPSTVSNVAKDSKTTTEPRPAEQGWGDKFKPKPGSWNCSVCYLNNDGTKDYCVSCDNPKEPGMPKKENKFDFGSGPKFNFGINNDASGSSPFKFSFGIPNQNLVTKSVAFEDETQAAKVETKDEIGKVCTFGAMQNEKHDFIFTPKNVSGKSPNKSQDAEDDNEYVQEDEGHHIFFEPLIPLPEKVEVKTGEEDEVILYSHRAKLFRFSDSEWKECGVGEVKILQNTELNKFRVVMRREPVLKICLNHALTSDIEYITKDEKTWLFSAPDFSTGEICHQQFCIRFVSKDVAVDFKKAIEKAMSSVTGSEMPESDDNDDVQFVSETSVTDAEIALARKYMLPDKFYAYKQLPKCTGCVGCADDDGADEKPTVKQINNPNNTFKFSLTPNLNTPSLIKSEKKETAVSTPVTSSIFGTSVFSPMLLGNAFKTPTNTTNAPLFGNSIFGGNTQNMFSNLANKTAAVDKPTEVKSMFSLANIFPGNDSQPKSLNTFSWNKETPVAKENSVIADSPNKTTDSKNEDNEPEENDIFFKPVIPLPDEVEVKTGEEDETVLYSHRAKLYRFADSEWKECGVGDIKILSHNETKKLRVLMRRNPIMKICLNHVLTSEVEYLPKDEKSWLFQACDFSTGEVLPQQFCVRFANKDVATEFKKAIETALEGKTKNESAPDETTNSCSQLKQTLVEELAAEKNDAKSKPEPMADPPASTVTVKAPFTGLTAPKFVVPDKPKEEVAPVAHPTVTVELQPKVNVAFGSTKPIGPGTNEISALLAKLTSNGAVEVTPAKSFTFGNITTTNSEPQENYFMAAATQEKKPSTESTNSEDKEKKTFMWAGAGTPLFGSNHKNNESKEEDGDKPEGEYDPHYEPIIPMPDEIKVVTGEEDENIVFTHKGKLFRYSDKEPKEWKERGIGDMKILHHPEKGTYRMLLRQHLVHKVVLNQLITQELELLPMSTDTKALVWVGMNYTDDEGNGAMEKLAIRFKNEDVATDFKNKVNSVINKLKSAGETAS